MRIIFTCAIQHIIEVLDENGQDTNYGNALLTNLFIRSFPMIRYNLRDMLDTEIINGLPVINKIGGRQDDKIKFADGKIVPVNIIAIIAEMCKELRDEEVDYVVDFVDRIPPDPNGKIRMLISRLDERSLSGTKSYIRKPCLIQSLIPELVVNQYFANLAVSLKAHAVKV